METFDSEAISLKQTVWKQTFADDEDCHFPQMIGDIDRPSGLDEKQQRITGAIGRYYDRLISSKGQRNCFFRAVNSLLGLEKAKNQSANYLIQHNQLDVYVAPSSAGRMTKYLEETETVTSASFGVAQFLQPNQSEHMELLSFLYSSPTLHLIIVLGYLSIVLLTGLLPKLIHPRYGRLQSLRLMAIKVFFLDYNLLPRLSRKLAVLVLFFNCFVFFNSNFLSGTIQTESALLKTDEIILSDFHLLNSKKTLVTEFGDYLEDYTDAFSSSVSSKMYFENLQSLLSIFFGAQLLILFVFVLPKRWSLLLRRIASLPWKAKNLLGCLYRRFRR